QEGQQSAELERLCAMCTTQKEVHASLLPPFTVACSQLAFPLAGATRWQGDAAGAGGGGAKAKRWRYPGTTSQGNGRGGGGARSRREAAREGAGTKWS